MSKCDNCDKNLTKRIPGLECSKCGKVVHANQACAGLSAKQLSALRNADGLEWICDECQRDSPKRKSSFIIPEDDDEEEVQVSGDIDTNCTIDTKKFLRDITSEMKKVMKKELEPIETSMSFCCKKIDALNTTIETQNKKIKDMEKKQVHLTNKNTHLELKIESLEQHVRQIEQRQLDNTVEVIGIPKVDEEDLENISNKLALTLNLDQKQVKNIKRIEGRNGQEGHVQVVLQQAEHAELWVRASKKASITAENILGNVSPTAAKSKVFVRRALTKYNKSLLWKAQQKLRPTYKYVWFQDGNVLARKGDKEKPMVIRREDDLMNMSTSQDTNLSR